MGENGRGRKEKEAQVLHINYPQEYQRNPKEENQCHLVFRLNVRFIRVHDWQGQGLRLEVHSWRNEELGVKDNKFLGSTQAEESMSPPWEVAGGCGS